MQTQDAPAELIFKLWPWLEANKTRLIGLAVAVIAVSGVLYFISAQRAQKEVDAGEALTLLMINPALNDNNPQTAMDLQQLAAKYAGTAAGERAQIQSAAALFDAGKYPEAQAQFQKYLDANSAGALAAIAELGLASSLEAQNQLAPAAAAYQRVVSVFPSSTCVQPAEFALGRIAEQQKKLPEAVAYYEKVVSSGLPGSLGSEARMRASELKAKIPAAAPKPEAAAPHVPAAAPAAISSGSNKPAAKP